MHNSFTPPEISFDPKSCRPIWSVFPAGRQGLKTQMGTNLLNLSPSFLVKRTWLGARLRLLWLVIRHSRCLRFVPAPDPYLPLQPFTVATFGSPFGILADPFREWVAQVLRAVSPCGGWLSGYSLRLATLVSIENFLRLTPPSVLHLKLQHPEERFVPSLLPAVRLACETCVPPAPLRLPSLCGCF